MLSKQNEMPLITVQNLWFYVF